MSLNDKNQELVDVIYTSNIKKLFKLKKGK